MYLNRVMRYSSHRSKDLACCIFLVTGKTNSEIMDLPNQDL